MKILICLCGHKLGFTETALAIEVYDPKVYCPKCGRRLQ